MTNRTDKLTGRYLSGGEWGKLRGADRKAANRASRKAARRAARTA